MTFKNIVKELIKRKLTIATMESCTGGGVANEITCIPGASEVLKFSAVTYSNEYKIKMGVNPEVIDKYSVYSIETAHEMAYNIAKFANADIGVGITGKLRRADINNERGNDNGVFFCIYYKGIYHDTYIDVTKNTRRQNKKMVIDTIITKLEVILNEENK